MTLTSINKRIESKETLTSLGINKTVSKRPIGIIRYNTTTGRAVECEVFAPYWEGDAPDIADTIKHLFAKGYGMIRLNTLVYSSLV